MEMMFLLNNSLGVLQNKLSSYRYIALAGVSLKMVFLYKGLSSRRGKIGPVKSYFTNV